MDRRFVAAAILGAPLLWLALRGLAPVAGPLAAWGTGLVLYWTGLLAALLAWGNVARLRELLRPASPGRLLWVLLALPPILIGAAAMLRLGDVILPLHVVAAVAIAAAANGTLEELYWRGAMVPEAEPRPLAAALALFALFHLAWAGAVGLALPGGLAGLMAGALALGGLWTAARLLTGTLGAAILSHALTSLGAFLLVVTGNWGPT